MSSRPPDDDASEIERLRAEADLAQRRIDSAPLRRRSLRRRLRRRWHRWRKRRW